MEDVVGRPSTRPSNAPETHNQSPPVLERRHSFRVHVEGRASLWRNNKLHGHYQLHDLCIAGCALSGRPGCKAGERVEVVLHLPEDRTLWLSATVRRSFGEQIALRFERPTARIEDRLQDLVVGAFARDHMDGHFSLVVEANPNSRRSLVHALDTLGERAVGVATPLDAVQLLLERGSRVETAFVGSPRTPAPSFELIEFLARNYPRIRRVLTGDGAALAASWVEEATGEVHALLETPCTEDALRKLVHRLEALPHDVGAVDPDATQA